MSRTLTILAMLAASMLGGALGTDDHETTADDETRGGIRLGIHGVLVDDQDAARTFYTEKLGFTVKHDIPLGPYSWLTVTAPGGPAGTELLLEPNAHEAAKTYQRALKADGIPAAMFLTDDLEAEVERLRAAGVEITTEPMDVGTAIMADFDDTCGNLIRLTQEK